jgi:hypothetical protein
MSTIIPYFDPILGKLRNSDVALISVATLVVTDPLIVNNLQVLSNGSINNLHTNTLYASTATIGNLTTNNIYNASTISTYIINTSRTDFNTSYVTNGEPVGSLYWNIDRDTLQVLTVGGEVDLGEDLMFYAVNQTGSTINKGTVVQFAGALGSSGKMLIAPAVADGSVSAIQILGITKETITDGDDGKVIMVGELRGINTSVYGTAGTILYIDPATPGGLTNTEPTAPNLRYPIAATLDSKNNGNLIIRAIFNPNLRDLNDVSVISLASGQVLMANASGVWSNQTINVALPSLGSLAVQNTVDYSQITNTPSLGSLAVLNDLSYTSLLNLPSLGSLAQISNVVVPLVLSGATLSISQASIVHDNLGGLTTGDPHTQYALLAGRSGGQTLFGGTVANNPLSLRANSVTGNSANTDAIRLGVGDNGATNALVLSQNGKLTHTVAHTFVNGYTLNQTITGTVGDSIGAFYNVTDTGGGVKTIFAHRARLIYSGATILQGMQATSNQAQVTGGGTVNALEVLTSNLDVTNNSTVVDAKLIRLFSPTVNTGGSIGALTGLAIPNLTQGTTNYSIYAEGGTMYHAGNVGIAMLPSFPLDVTGDIRSSANVRANNFLGNTADSATAPSYTFEADTNTGMYHPTTDNLGFTTAGTERIRINSTGFVGILNSTPSYALDVTGDIRSSGNVIANNGIFASQVSINNLNGSTLFFNTGTIQNFSANSVDSGNGVFTGTASINTIYTNTANASTVNVGVTLSGDGTAAVPAFSFTADPDTGMFRQAVNAIGFATAGTEDFRITDAQAMSVNGGTAALPAFSFTADNDIGMYRAGTDILAFATAGAEAVRITAVNRLGVNTNNPAAQTDIRQTSTTGAVPVLYLNQTDISEEFIQFQSTISTGHPISVATALPAAPTHRIRVSVAGTLRFFYVYAT